MELNLNPRLARTIVRIAREQGRDENEVLEEAVLRYLRERGFEPGEPGIGREVGEVRVAPPAERSQDAFVSLLSRMSSRFDLDEDEAMRVALEEQRAFRRERAERERTEP